MWVCYMKLIRETGRGEWSRSKIKVRFLVFSPSHYVSPHFHPDLSCFSLFQLERWFGILCTHSSTPSRAHWLWKTAQGGQMFSTDKHIEKLLRPWTRSTNAKIIIMFILYSHQTRWNISCMYLVVVQRSADTVKFTEMYECSSLTVAFVPLNNLNAKEHTS